MFLVLICAIMICATVSPAEAVMFCGDSIVGEGDSKADVVRECGQPFMKSTPKYNYRKRRGRRTTSDGNTWYYNQGEGSSMKVLKFSNGRLQKIENSNKRGW